MASRSLQSPNLGAGWDHGRIRPDHDTGPLLVGVNVAPDFPASESGLTDALLAAIDDWARTERDQSTLHVHEENSRAGKA